MVHLLKRGAAGARLAVAAVAVATASAAACAPLLAAGPSGPRAPDPRLDPTERAVQLRVALAALKEEHPDLSPLEVTRAEAWLDRAEALTRTSTNPELRDLLLDTAEGQLTLLRSEVSLTLAEAGDATSDASSEGGPRRGPRRAPERGRAGDGGDQ